MAYPHILAAEKLVQTLALSSSDHERVDDEAFLVTNDEPVHFWDFARPIWVVAEDKTTTKWDFGGYSRGDVNRILWVKMSNSRV